MRGVWSVEVHYWVEWISTAAMVRSTVIAHSSWFAVANVFEFRAALTVSCSGVIGEGIDHSAKDQIAQLRIGHIPDSGIFL